MNEHRTSGIDRDRRSLDPLAPALRAGFGPPGDSAGWGGAGVLATLDDEAARSSVVLRDEPDETAGVVDPRSPEMPLIPQGSGRFQIAGEIARGGIGVILRGRDMDLGREVALKLLRTEYAANPLMVRRLVEEAQIGGQLQHPGVLPVYELGLDPNRRPYFAMKLVRGRTLAAILADRVDAAVDRHRVLMIFDQICHTVAYAHARGVIHRDLKPSNIMVGAFGEVQVVDWGLAKVVDRPPTATDHFPAASEPPIDPIRVGSSGSSRSEAGSVLGTPSYMSPEQARGETAELDERCDVFALGAILCEVLTGLPPYTGARADVLRKATQGLLDDALARLDAAPEDAPLVGLARRCLAPARDDRPRDAGHVAREVSGYLAAVEQRARAAELDAATARARASADRRARRLSTALATALLVATALAGAMLWSEHDRRARLEGAVRVLAALDAKGAWVLRHAADAPDADVALWLELVLLTRAAAERAAETTADSDRRDRARELVAALTSLEVDLRKRIPTARPPRTD
jgi:serine/threonine-protein kinase